MSVDYKLLLAKYIEYIEVLEGSNGIDAINDRYSVEVNFTDEEWKALEDLSV